MGIKPETEREFQRTVVQYARLRNWWVWHDTDSRKNAAGWPDLVLVRDGTLVFAELKSARGRVRPAQAAVLALLEAVAAKAGGAVRVCVWRPADWGTIEEVLR